MQRRPRPPGASPLQGCFVGRVVRVSVLMMTGAFGQLPELSLGTGARTSRTMAANAIVVAEMY